MHLTYEQWGFIADCYSPILVILTLAIIVWRALPPHNRPIKFDTLFLLSGLLFVYGLKGADSLLGIWLAVGLDYSTHTAFSLLFVSFLAFQSKFIALASITSLLLYGALMLKQEYHTVGDMLSTVFVVLPLFLLSKKALSTLANGKSLGRSRLTTT